MKVTSLRVVWLMVWLYVPWQAWSQDSTKMHFRFPTHEGWNNVREGEKLEFTLRAAGGSDSSYAFSLPEGKPSGAQFDSLGSFSWTPGFDFVERLQENKTAQMLFEVTNAKGESMRQQVDIKVSQVNQPPVIGEMKNWYVQYNVVNTYQIDPGAVKDIDNDPLVFVAITEQMPEGAKLSAKGEFTWKPSLGQFNQLKSKPLTLEFLVEDQPGKAQTKGKLSVQATQMDLPPTITMVPNPDKIRINEDTPVSLEFYLEDPNGDDNIKTFDFISTDPRLSKKTLVQNTPTQYEFLWRPDYNFVNEAKDSATVSLTFFVIDKTNKRDEQKITITVLDTENEQEKERMLYNRYRSALVSACELMEQLKAKEKELKTDLREAKKGKKNRSIVNASMGAVTGLSPAVLQANPTTQKVVSSVGGTTVLTMGTLEATNVIGKSQGELIDKLNKTIEKRNELQTRGDIFTRKYALSSARHNQAFPNDVQDFIALMNLNTTLELELDASWKNNKGTSDSQISRTFKDFVPFSE